MTVFFQNKKQPSSPKRQKLHTSAVPLFLLHEAATYPCQPVCGITGSAVTGTCRFSLHRRKVLQPNCSKGIFPNIQPPCHTNPRLSADLLIRTLPYQHIFPLNLHAPGNERATNYESLAGAFGIPDFESPPAMGSSL